MGGFGSGSWQRGKTLTTQRKRLDIGKMQSDARVVWPKLLRWSDGTSVTVSFRETVAVVQTCTPGQSTYPTHVELDKTLLHFGGHRVWWKCPCCHGRVGVLYWQDWRWQCRKCADLIHKSTRQSDNSRAYARVNKVRDALGWGGGLLSPMGTRPKGMHLATYARLMQELASASVATVGASDQVIERLDNRLRKIRIPT